MAVEAFHRTLKHNYLDGKQNRRIDKLLCVLLQIAKDKLYEAISKSEKGTVHES